MGAHDSEERCAGNGQVGETSCVWCYLNIVCVSKSRCFPEQHEVSGEGAGGPEAHLGRSRSKRVGVTEHRATIPPSEGSWLAYNLSATLYLLK